MGICNSGSLTRSSEMTHNDDVDDLEHVDLTITVLGLPKKDGDAAPTIVTMNRSLEVFHLKTKLASENDSLPTARLLKIEQRSVDIASFKKVADLEGAKLSAVTVTCTPNLRCTPSQALDVVVGTRGPAAIKWWLQHLPNGDNYAAIGDLCTENPDILAQWAAQGLLAGLFSVCASEACSADTAVGARTVEAASELLYRIVIYAQDPFALQVEEGSPNNQASDKMEQAKSKGRLALAFAKALQEEDVSNSIATLTTSPVFARLYEVFAAMLFWARSLQEDGMTTAAVAREGVSALTTHIQPAMARLNRADTLKSEKCCILRFLAAAAALQSEPMGNAIVECNAPVAVIRVALQWGAADILRNAAGAFIHALLQYVDHEGIRSALFSGEDSLPKLISTQPEDLGEKALAQWLDGRRLFAARICGALDQCARDSEDARAACQLAPEWVSFNEAVLQPYRKAQMLVSQQPHKSGSTPGSPAGRERMDTPREAVEPQRGRMDTPRE